MHVATRDDPNTGQPAAAPMDVNEEVPMEVKEKVPPPVEMDMQNGDPIEVKKSIGLHELLFIGL